MTDTYYFYIVMPFDRPGFGIAQDIKDRSQKYSSHTGKLVNFPFIYAGHRPHAKALERAIKTVMADKIWVVEDWRTEWLDVTLSELKETVDTLISERHFKIKCIMKDYDFTKDLSNSVDL